MSLIGTGKQKKRQDEEWVDICTKPARKNHVYHMCIYVQRMCVSERERVSESDRTKTTRN